MTQSFSLIKENYIPSLNITLQEFVHEKTKAKHIHLACDDTNNVFLVGFLTVPEDSTGVAHILEHTALCGSEKYPVRDPFFMMIRRSLNTFMNAFTASDWTAYPFASQNKKDFYNLLNIYLDAAFFPKLDYLDFRQEGHRLEFEEMTNPESPLTYKGVVFNEMKGAMSSIGSVLYHEITKHLFPTITYHNNSGGEPSDIPNLTHEALVAFHKKHYHPSNSVFVTYGNMDPADHQAVFEERALNRFDHQDFDFSVPDEKRFTAPIRYEGVYPLPKEEPLENQSHVINAWLLNPITDAKELMRARILEGVLLDNSSSPLQKVLETTDLGAAPSMFCGLEDGTREAFFACGLEGASSDKVDAIDALITKTLEDVKANGVPQEDIEAVLHQLELSSREITGDRYPYGLRLIVDCLTPVLHGGEALEVLSFDDTLKQMREEIQDPQFIPNLIDRLLLSNPHKLTLTLNPSHTLADELVEKENARLRELESSLTADEKQKIIDDAVALQERQARVDDASILPMVEREDIPKTLEFPEVSYEGNKVYAKPTTNGMTYQSLVVELPALTEEEMTLLPYLDALITEVGCGENDYLTQQAKAARVTGGIGARTMYQPRKNSDRVKGLWVISGKALLDNHKALAEILKETFFTARFNETKRIQEILAQIKLSREQAIVGNGHAYAMAVASQNIAPINQLSQRLSGMQSIKDFRALEASVKDETACLAFGEKLAALLVKLQQAPFEVVTLNDSDAVKSIADQFGETLGHEIAAEFTPFEIPFEFSGEKVKLGWAINAPVHYCAKSYKTVTQDHEDAPVFNVLAAFLRNGYLHRAIREQGGAYGGGASYNSNSGAFNFFSYRDPRLEETLKDFDASIDWLLETDHEALALEEAILGVISAIDKPKTPASEYGDVYFMKHFDRTPDEVLSYRANVLNVTIDDLKRVAREYFSDRDTHTAVLGPIASLEKTGLEIKQL